MHSWRSLRVLVQILWLSTCSSLRPTAYQEEDTPRDGRPALQRESSVSKLERQKSLIPDLKQADSTVKELVAPDPAITSNWDKFIAVISPKSTNTLITTIAKVIVWAVGNAVVIAFPPLAVVGVACVAIASLLIEAASLVAETGSLGTLTTWKGFCNMASDVNMNLLVGMTGGIAGAVPALILSVDALDMIITETKGIPGLSDHLHGCPGLFNYEEALLEIRAQRTRSVTELVSRIPWAHGFGSAVGECHCSDCEELHESQYCSDHTCMVAYQTKCKGTCDVLGICFGGNLVDMKLKMSDQLLGN